MHVVYKIAVIVKAFKYYKVNNGLSLSCHAKLLFTKKLILSTLYIFCIDFSKFTAFQFLGTDLYSWLYNPDKGHACNVITLCKSIFPTVSNAPNNVYKLVWLTIHKFDNEPRNRYIRATNNDITLLLSVG